MLVVHASELAACVGLNRYRPVADAAIVLFSRMNPSVYEAAMARNALREKESIERTLEQIPGAIAAVKEAVEAAPDDLGSRIDDLIKDVGGDNQVSAADLTSLVYTERGKNAEESSLDRVQDSWKKQITQRNTKYYKKQLSYGGERYLLLGGRVDGITDDGELVEVKNRQRRIFSSVPIYEKVQVHAYMYLTDIKECKLVQSFKGSDVITKITFDDQFWNDVRNRLTIFATRMDHLCQDEKAQDSLLVQQEFPIDFQREAAHRDPSSPEVEREKPTA